MQCVRALTIGVEPTAAADLEGEGIAVDRVGSIDEAVRRLSDGWAPRTGDATAVETADSDATATLEDVGDEPAVDDADGSDAARRQLPIHCVVAAVDGSDDPTFELPELVCDVDEFLPVVLVGEEPLSTVAEDVLRADAEAYVTLGDAGDGAADRDNASLTGAIQDAAATYRQRLDRTRTHADLPDAGLVLRDGTVAAASPEVAGLFGVETVVDRAPAELVASDDRDPLEAALTSTDATTRELWVAPAGDSRRTVEVRFRRSNADGAIVARVHDVTDEANDRVALSETAEQLDSLLKHVPMSIYFKDTLGRHERVSDFITQTDPEEYIMNAEGKVHPHPDDVVGKTDWDLYDPAFAEETYADDMEVIEDEEHVVSRIESGTTSLGEDLYTSTTKVPRYDENDEVIGLVGVTMDVTERITHQKELERQNERLNEFAEVLTHDLRNPLNIANGYLDVLSEGHDEQAIVEATAALDRMESLIEEIRAFVLEGRLVEDPEAVDLRDAAEEAWSTVETGGATLEVDGDLSLKADRARLRRLLENLFRNALEHGSPGEDEGTVEPLTVRVVAGHTEFAVEDDGAGIPEDGRSEVFERGYSTSNDGTGFGLAIVKSIAEAHGWTVTAGESEAGGARFEFTNVVRAQIGFGRTIA